MIEQRKSTRHKTFFGAHLSVEALAGWSVDCTVKNLGGGGARISLPPRTTIPDNFKLDIPTKTSRSSARLVWYRDGLVGVAFGGNVAHADNVVPHFDVTKSTLLERRIAAIVGRGPAHVIPFERRAPAARG